MGHGKMIIKMNTDINRFNTNVLADFEELKDEYPFSYLTFFPLHPPILARIQVVAANKKLIERLSAIETDFLGLYSKKVIIYVPDNYRKDGCKVFGAAWIDPTIFNKEDTHFYLPVRPDGYELCVGTPESFPLMKNVILENIKTADNMMIAYESVMTGSSNHLNLNSYSHGYRGRCEFETRWKHTHQGIK